MITRIFWRETKRIVNNKTSERIEVRKGQEKIFVAMRNVEIKAKVHDENGIKLKAKYLSKSDGVIIKQHDTFFKVSSGRLKLRRFEDGSGELIHYDRPDTEGPKISDYVKTNITKDNIEGIEKVLERSNGVLGDVKKIRILHIVDQTRIHIDKVDGLGNFMELEVVLNENQSLEDGEKIAEKLMYDLDVKNEDLISNAYLDMIIKGKQKKN